MKNNFYSFLICLILIVMSSKSIYAQCVNFIIDSQTDISTFPNSCTEIDGSIWIFYDANVTNFQGFSHLERIEGDLQIWADNPTSLEGFENLRYVGGNVDIRMNSLENFTGFDKLDEIGGDLRISGCDNLVNFLGFEDLDVIGGSFFVTGNDSLINFEGLDDLESCSLLKVEFNGQLRDFEGLVKFENVYGNTFVFKNDMLEDFKGLEKLTTIEGKLEIENNPNLSCFRGLENLTSIGTSFKIYYNHGLIGLGGLEQLSEVGTTIQITENPKLMLCHLPNICEMLDNGASFDIFNNAPACNSEISIFLKCGTGFCPEDLALSRQSQVSNFPTIFPGCTQINGDLILDTHDNFNSNNLDINIKDLGGLIGIESILGGLFVGSTFFDDDELSSLEGLNNLKKIEGDVDIRYLDELIDIDALNNLDSIGGYLYLGSLAKLTEVNGFNNLDQVGGTISFNENELLESISGFEDLESADKVVISNNENLISLSGFDQAEWVDGFYFYDNPQLSHCGAWPICDILSTMNVEFSLDNNAIGCNTAGEVANDCGEVFSRVEGQVFIDLNCNSIVDTEEPLILYHPIKSLGEEVPFAFTDATGTFFRLVPPESEFSIFPDSIEGFYPNPDVQEWITGLQPSLFDNKDFGFCPVEDFVDLNAALNELSPPRPGFDNGYQICFENIGSITANATASLDFQNNATAAAYVTIIDAGGGMINNNSIEWTIGNLLPFEPYCFNVQINLSPEATLGELLIPKIGIEYTGMGEESNLDNNFTILEQEIVGSYDPNDKMVSPNRLTPEDVVDGTLLQYQVRFQNTGTYPATFIEVLDTLENKLDVSTFRMIAASHDYEVSFIDSNVVKWRFEDINLPDSTSNEPESHGFIKFEIRTVPNLNLNDFVANRVGIYFDYNEPVITNYALFNVEIISSTLNPDEDFNLQLFPNPSNGKVVLIIEDNKVNDYQLVLYNQQGITVELFDNIASNDLILLNDLTPGVYFIRLMHEKQSVTKKLIIY